MGIFGSIAYLLGVLLYILYTNLWFSYGLAIIVLTIILKFVLFPLSVKSFFSMAKTSELQPLITELQRKYKDDKETLNKEMMKMYQEKKINPFSGCLPLLLQIPILYALFLLISNPVTYVLQNDQIKNSAVYATYISPTAHYNEVKFLDMVQKKEIDIQKFEEDLKKEYLAKNEELKVDFDKIVDFKLYFAGINLGDVPTPIPQNFYQCLLWIFPILSGLTTFFSSKYGQIPQPPDSPINPMQKQMLIMMPIMAAYFSFVVPAGLSLYWLTGNLFQIVQQRYLIAKYLKQKEA